MENYYQARDPNPHLSPVETFHFQYYLENAGLKVRRRIASDHLPAAQQFMRRYYLIMQGYNAACSPGETQALARRLSLRPHSTYNLQHNQQLDLHCDKT